MCMLASHRVNETRNSFLSPAEGLSAVADRSTRRDLHVTNERYITLPSLFWSPSPVWIEIVVLYTEIFNLCRSGHGHIVFIVLVLCVSFGVSRGLGFLSAMQSL